MSKTHPHILKYISKENALDPETVTIGTGEKMKFVKDGKEFFTTPRNFLRYIKEFKSFPL